MNLEMKIIYFTGYEKLTEADKRVETGLGKPFTIIELRYMIGQQFDV
ncbi:hypothetical protein [Ghiorsea bivora]|nr:hypothetical protein [Ghiorsea bivora]